MKQRKGGGKWDGKASKLLSSPSSPTVQIQVFLQQVFGFRKEMAGNSDLLNGKLDKTSGQHISLTVMATAPV